jgi:hypothetical protein
MKSLVAKCARYPKNSERLRCLVVESGSTPLASIRPEAFDQTILVTQMSGEQPTAFAQRAMAKIAAVERSGRQFAELTLLTGSLSDVASRAARRLLVLGLSTHARAVGSLAELVLSAPEQLDSHQRSELFELAEEIMATAPSGGMPIRISFGAARGAA